MALSDSTLRLLTEVERLPRSTPLRHALQRDGRLGFTDGLCPMLHPMLGVARVTVRVAPGAILAGRFRRRVLTPQRPGTS